MPSAIHGVESSDVHAKIQLLIDALVNSKDETGEYTVTALDGRVLTPRGGMAGTGHTASVSTAYGPTTLSPATKNTSV